MNDILSTLDDKTKIAVNRRWRWLFTREIKKFVREKIKTSKFRNIKPSGRYFGTRSLKKSDSILMFGTKPNAGIMFGFSAPVDERIISNRRRRFYNESGWHSTKKEQITSDSLGAGLKKGDVSYFRTSEKPEGRYFGIKRKKKIVAYGMSRSNEVLPVYNDEAIPDWLMDVYGDEVDALITACGELAIEQVLGEAF